MYHIKDNGDMGVCRAKEGNCPLKNSDNTPVRHFNNIEDAFKFYENMMGNKTFSSITKKRKKI